jgi:hypothetical protein
MGRVLTWAQPQPPAPPGARLLEPSTALNDRPAPPSARRSQDLPPRAGYDVKDPLATIPDVADRLHSEIQRKILHLRRRIGG